MARALKIPPDDANRYLNSKVLQVGDTMDSRVRQLGVERDVRSGLGVQPTAGAFAREVNGKKMGGDSSGGYFAPRERSLMFSYSQAPPPTPATSGMAQASTMGEVGAHRGGALILERETNDEAIAILKQKEVLMAE